MRYSVGVVMDPISQVNTKKDTSFAMLLEAQKRGLTIYYFEMSDLYIENGIAKGLAKTISVKDQTTNFYSLGAPEPMELSTIDVLLMRKDPPFDSEYLYATHILGLAEEAGCLVVNRPQSLRDFNEKLFTSWFPDLIPATLVTRNTDLIKSFHKQHGDIICKPLDGMGGASIFRVKPDGTNLGVIIETITQHGTQQMMVQEYLPEIKDGDKRILIVDGEPMPYALARLPSKGETRGNLAAGGTGRPQPLSEKDKEIALTIAPKLKEKGLLFVGLDVIGDRVTEINVTSPTCVREIEAQYNINIIAKLFDAIEGKLTVEE